MNDIKIESVADNMAIWNKVKNVPAQYLKKITGGRLKGMSDISPQWRLQVLTETFGPCGIGWYYEIVDRGKEDLAGEVSAHVMINLYVKIGGEWSKPIPGIGGSMLVAKEKNGPYHSDEAFKMSLTDALSVACKALGIAAEVYLGHGGKYDRPEPVDIAEDLAAIEAATDLEGLKEAFSKSYNARRGNADALAELAAAKDRKKRVLTVSSVFNGEVTS